ncbi:Glutaminase 2 [Gossypium arboreum]|uniref:Glutaminase 2 n=1 Tax=Gossypium arboreum TaxID=29729 RepID=A0A0B0PZ92_GOSAR|nr:Glutaminase 2 [Gossypium arboreum]
MGKGCYRCGHKLKERLKSKGELNPIKGRKKWSNSHRNRSTTSEILARQLSDSGFLEVEVSHTIKAPFWYNFG